MSSSQSVQLVLLPLHCTVWYCMVIYCMVLYCTVLYCIVLYCTVLYYTYNIMFYTVLYCTIVFYTVRFYTVLYFIVFCVGASKGPPVLYSSYSTEHQRIVLYAYLQKQLIIIINKFYNNRLCRQWLTSDQYAASQWRSQKPETRQGTTRAHVPFIIIYPYIFPSFYCHVRQSKTIQYLYYSL